MKEKLKKILNNKKGFTLVEVTVASIIVVIVSVMLVTIFLSAANINKKSFDKINDSRNIGFDIYVNGSSGAGENVPLELTQNGVPLSDVSIPMDVMQFQGERSAADMWIFRTR